MSSNLVIRLATAVVGIPILIWMLIFAPPIVWSSVVVVAAAVGGWELGMMVLPDAKGLQAYLVFASACVAALGAFEWDSYLVPAFLALGALGPLFMLTHPEPIESAGNRMAWLIAGPLYIGFCASALARLHHIESNGGLWVLLSMALAWGSDTGGYFAGRAFGKHKLYERISPKKTVEGSIGGLAAVVVFALIARHFWLHEMSIVQAIVLALVAGAAGQTGDLCISLIKRSTNTKDSGFIIPGHGGLLDRIDALLFTAPITFVFTAYWLQLSRSAPHF